METCNQNIQSCSACTENCNSKNAKVASKLENKLQVIYIDKGYDLTCDNRSYFTKSLNKVLCNPDVSFELCKKGYVWTSKDGFKFNLRIRIAGKGKIFKLNSFSPELIAECFASVAKMEHVKQSIHIHQDAYECSKCHGKGFIPAFSHVCKGVCFDCLGIGFRFHSGNW